MALLPLAGHQGQRPLGYIKHFAIMPGVPMVMAPLIFIIEIISHMSRVLSLTLRLSATFSASTAVLIIASIVPLCAAADSVPGLIVGPQAFIFLTLGDLSHRRHARGRSRRRLRQRRLAPGADDRKWCWYPVASIQKSKRLPGIWLLATGYLLSPARAD